MIRRKLTAALAMSAFIGALSLGAASPASAETDTLESDISQGFTVVAWSMDTWVDDRTATWPQSYFTSTETQTPDLGLLDSSLPCGTQYQIDIYIPGPATDSLIAGGFLNGPGDPAEALMPGGWDVAYKLVQTEPCYVPPVVECEPGTVPGWLNEHGDPTSCVDDHPCIANEVQDADCNPIVPPPVNPPPAVEPPAASPPAAIETPAIEPPSESEPVAVTPAPVETAPTLPETGPRDSAHLWFVSIALMLVGMALAVRPVVASRRDG